MQYFKGIDTLSEGKKLYHTLLHENHPDKGGDNDICNEIIRQFNDLLQRLMQAAFNTQGDDKTGDSDIRNFVDILRKVKDFNMDIEIIGHWIWAFRGSFEYKEQLKQMGFWFSKTKKAWVYNGQRHNRKVRGHYSMNQIRNRHTVRKIREYAEEKETSTYAPKING